MGVSRFRPGPRTAQARRRAEIPDRVLRRVESRRLRRGVWTGADDVLHFESGAQRIRMRVKYENYKKFEGQSTIKFGEVVDESKPDQKKPEEKKQ